MSDTWVENMLIDGTNSEIVGAASVGPPVLSEAAPTAAPAEPIYFSNTSAIRALADLSFLRASYARRTEPLLTALWHARTDAVQDNVWANGDVALRLAALQSIRGAEAGIAAVTAEFGPLLAAAEQRGVAALAHLRGTA